MYIFVFLWTPVLDTGATPLGMVFSCFMVSSNSLNHESALSLNLMSSYPFYPHIFISWYVHIPISPYPHIFYILLLLSRCASWLDLLSSQSSPSAAFQRQPYLRLPMSYLLRSSPATFQLSELPADDSNNDGDLLCHNSTRRLEHRHRGLLPRLPHPRDRHRHVLPRNLLPEVIFHTLFLG